VLDNHNQDLWLMLRAVLAVTICTSSWANLHPHVDCNCDYDSDIPGSQDICEKAIDIALSAAIKGNIL